MNCIEWNKCGGSWFSQNNAFQIHKTADTGKFDIFDIRNRNNEKTVAIGCETFEQAVRVAQGYWLEQA